MIIQNRVEKVVPCDSLYPFVCTRNAGKIGHAIFVRCGFAPLVLRF